jgi:RNA-binding protein
MPLSGNQRRFLRALGHHLNPIVQIGHQGTTENVIGALKQALNDHELVKVKFNQNVDERSEALETLVEGSGGECVQVLGRTALIYLKHPKKPQIKLPAPRSTPTAAKTKAVKPDEESYDAGDEGEEAE